MRPEVGVAFSTSSIIPDLLNFRLGICKEKPGSRRLGLEVGCGTLLLRKAAQRHFGQNMSLRAFLSRRVVTPDGIKPAAVLVEDGRILDVVPPDQLAARTPVTDFGEAAILPGLG